MNSPSNKAPVGIVGMKPFSAARPQEMVKTEYEFILPDGAGEPLYHYPIIEHGRIELARRYWALPGRLLVGGRIRDASDYLGMVSAFGVTHVLSFESEQTDDSKVPQRKRAQAPFPDDGKPPPLGLMIQVVQWIKDLPRDGVVLYCHCRLGGSRGPTAAYAALRVRWQMGRGRAQKFAGRRPCGSALFKTYLDQVDKAVLEVCGR